MMRYTTYALTILLLITVTMLPFSFFTRKPHPIIIMLDCPGDAHHAGRKIGDCFERGVSLQCVERLKIILEQTYPYARVMLTRTPGQVEQPLQQANFSNHMHADVYISIHFYQEHESKPRWYIYCFSYGNDFIIPSTSLALYTYDKAHLINKQTTQRWATLIQQTLTQEPYMQYYNYYGPYKIPFKPLIGIKAPAIAYEIGLQNPHDWTRVVDIIASSLSPIINECQTQ